MLNKATVGVTRNGCLKHQVKKLMDNNQFFIGPLTFGIFYCKKISAVRPAPGVEIEKISVRQLDSADNLSI